MSTYTRVHARVHVQCTKFDHQKCTDNFRIIFVKKNHAFNLFCLYIEEVKFSNLYGLINKIHKINYIILSFQFCISR